MTHRAGGRQDISSDDTPKLRHIAGDTVRLVSLASSLSYPGYPPPPFTHRVLACPCYSTQAHGACGVTVAFGEA